MAFCAAEEEHEIACEWPRPTGERAYLSRNVHRPTLLHAGPLESRAVLSCPGVPVRSLAADLNLCLLRRFVSVFRCVAMHRRKFTRIGMVPARPTACRESEVAERLHDLVAPAHAGLRRG